MCDVYVFCIVVDGSLCVYVCIYILCACLWFVCSMSVSLCVCVRMLYILLFVCSVCVYVWYVVYIAVCQCVWYIWLSVCGWCPNPSFWYMDSRIYVSIFHVSFSLTSFSRSTLEKNQFLGSIFPSGAPHLWCYFIWVLLLNPRLYMHNVPWPSGISLMFQSFWSPSQSCFSGVRAGVISFFNWTGVSCLFWRDAWIRASMPWS